MYNILFCRFNKRIETTGKVRLVGPISIQIKKNGKLFLGDDLRVVSGLMLNPLGRNISSSIRVDKDAQITIGNNVGMSNVSLWAKTNIRIGNNVKIGADCLLFDSDMHSLDFVKRRKPSTDAINAKSSEIIIEDDVFIGTRSIISKGVTIGKRSIVASGSVLVKSIPQDEIWGGNPAKFIKKIIND
ncbi:acyltransferase [Flavobacterium sp. W22_SRS_FK3]|uniref:acyltransferase n=1 Tax=Flavobacterium sp. W22_SRS_FK3 TaxID=3240275 RepID=UPI003F8F7434